MRARSRVHVGLLVVAVIVWSGAAMHAQSRTARTVRFQSDAIGGQAIAAVLLPVEYDSSTARYPVVYLLHGGTQNHTAFPARNWFTADASGRHMIVVMPYLQPLFFSPRGGAAAPFEDFLGRELPTYIDDHYRTITEPRGRAIAGISMGGYGATMIGIKRPDVFGAVGAISAALSTGARPGDIASLVAAVSADRAPYFYVACGLADSVLPSSRDLAARLREQKISVDLREVPGGHGWDVWDPQVRAFFDALSKRPGWGPRPD
jgi:putative tributyrin esterase